MFKLSFWNQILKKYISIPNHISNDENHVYNNHKVITNNKNLVTKIVPKKF